MKNLLLKYARYNTWANKQVIDTMLNLQAGLVDRQVSSSFTSLRSTVYHCWSAEDIWLQRLNKVDSPVWTESIFKGSFADACANWQVISTGLEHFVAKVSTEELDSVLSFTDIRQNNHTMLVNDILLHVFNHATYHRGQLITLLRSVGETIVPRTDYIVYARIK